MIASALLCGGWYSAERSSIVWLVIVVVSPSRAAWYRIISLALSPPVPLSLAYSDLAPRPRKKGHIRGRMDLRIFLFYNFIY
jgi:hypothetical protein